jgi:ligand-binding SRPBCC domain-containing protein
MRTLIDCPIDDVFAFFSDAGNLERLTPSFLNFRIVTPLPIEMKQGALIKYQIKLFGIKMRWLTEITKWEPNRRFSDVQREGPYLLWDHEHRFRRVGNSTLMVDTVRYALPGGILEPIVHRLFVRKRIEEIFEYRERAISRLFHRAETGDLAMCN